MAETIAGWLVTVLGIYAGAGLVFGAAFILRGAARVDPQADGGSWGFRLAILPGTVAFWPLLARRWARGGPPPEERSPHREPAGGGRR